MVRGPAQQDVVGDAHRAGHYRALRYVGYRARPGAAVGTPVLTATNADLALVRDEAGDGAGQGRFPCSVGADDAQPSSPLDAGRNAGQDGGPAQNDRRSFDIEHFQLSFLDWRSTTKKKGAPKNAVTTPSGTSPGEMTVRAMRSAKMRNAAPNNTESGRMRR